MIQAQKLIRASNNAVLRIKGIVRMKIKIGLIKNGIIGKPAGIVKIFLSVVALLVAAFFLEHLNTALAFVLRTVQQFPRIHF